MGMEEEFAAKISSGLGMGVNHGDSCGAVTSTALALGLAQSFSSGAHSSVEGGIEDKVKELESAFIERNGSLLCRDLLSGGYDASDPNANAPEGVDPWENCAKYCTDVDELAERYLTPDAIAKRPMAERPQEQPSPIIIGAGSGAAGLALGAGAMAAIAYERRRTENEKPQVAYLYLVDLCEVDLLVAYLYLVGLCSHSLTAYLYLVELCIACGCIIQPGTNMQSRA